MMRKRACLAGLNILAMLLTGCAMAPPPLPALPTHANGLTL